MRKIIIGRKIWLQLRVQMQSHWNPTIFYTISIICIPNPWYIITILITVKMHVHHVYMEHDATFETSLFIAKQVLQFIFFFPVTIKSHGYMFWRKTHGSISTEKTKSSYKCIETWFGGKRLWSESDLNLNLSLTLH